MIVPNSKAQKGKASTAAAAKPATSRADVADERILQLLLLLLDAGVPMSRAEIFERIRAYQTKKPEAGERKFERDKDDLRTLGVIIEESNEEGDSYRISQKGYELPPIELDDDERVALILAAESLRAAEGLPYRELAEDALRKLSFYAPRLNRAYAPAQVGISLPSREKGARMRRTLAQLSGAVDGRKQVTITYAAGNADKPSERKVDPYGLIYSAGDWHLVGLCHLRNAQRTFRVDRIVKLKVAPKPGTPDFEPPAGFDLAAYASRSPWVFQAGEGSATLDVVLDVGPERAWMAEENFGADATVQPVPEAEAGQAGWVRVRFRSGNPGYIVTRVLDAAGNMKVVAPPELRARVRQIAGAVATACRAEGSAP
jgi:proteasome accessory factor B